MKNPILLLLMCFNLTLGFSQKGENIFDANFKNVIFIGQYDVRLSKPSILNLFGKEMREWYVNNDEIFEDLSYEDDKFLLFDNLHSSLQSKAFCEFFPMLTKDTAIQLQAKSKHLIYFDLIFTKEKGKETFTISLPDRSCSKEINYQNGKFESMFIVNKDSRIVVQDDRSDSSIFTTVFYTDSRKFSNVEYFYSKGLLKKVLYYKSSKDKNSKKVKESIVYNYNNSGRVVSKLRYNGDNDIKDSTRYIYEDSKLKSIFSYNQNSHEYISYNYKGNKISDFIDKTDFGTTEVFYTYDSDNKLINERIDNGGNTIYFYSYEYNSNSQLISTKAYSYLREDPSDLEMRSNGIFTYYDSGILKSYIFTNKANEIMKETVYSIK